MKLQGHQLHFCTLRGNSGSGKIRKIKYNLKDKTENGC